MAILSAANTKYIAEQLTKATDISTETLANLRLIESTETLTISELDEKAASDAQARTVLDKIVVRNAETVALHLYCFLAVVLNIPKVTAPTTFDIPNFM